MGPTYTSDLHYWSGALCGAATLATGLECVAAQYRGHTVDSTGVQPRVFSQDKSGPLSSLPTCWQPKVGPRPHRHPSLERTLLRNGPE